MRLLKFIANAHKHGHAYIDMDGCLLRRMLVPSSVLPSQALDWWMKNLSATAIVKRRLILLYVLKLLGVQLHIWTNRSPQHEALTRKAFGRHIWLFSSMSFAAGKKRALPRLGPCIDDEESNIGTLFYDLLVRTK